MGAFTSRAGLYKPGGGSTGLILPDETVDIDKLNGNFDKIDALLGARNIPSASSYSGNMDGDLVYAQDTKFLQMYSAADSKLITPKLPGSNAYKGTKAQRDAFTVATEGDTWRTTDDDKREYVRVDGEWVRAGGVHQVAAYGASAGTPVDPADLVMRTGVASGTTNAAGVLTHTFPVPFPTACVAVSFMPNQNRVAPVLEEAGATRQKFNAFYAGAANQPRTIQYFAWGY